MSNKFSYRKRDGGLQGCSIMKRGDLRPMAICNRLADEENLENAQLIVDALNLHNNRLPKRAITRPMVLKYFSPTLAGDWWTVSFGHVIGEGCPFNGWVVTGWNEAEDSVFVAKGLIIEKHKADFLCMRFFEATASDEEQKAAQ